METVTLKMEASLLEEIDSTLAKHRYSTRTEFMRDAIRCKLSAFEKEEAIRKLTAMKGFLKGKAKSNISEEEAGELAFKELEDEMKTGKKDVAYEKLVKKLGIRSK
jgi:Arc/MetJ-type ribon-helix-helix transcriptional regulator